MSLILPIPQHTPYVNSADTVVDLPSLFKFMVIAWDHHPFVVLGLAGIGCCVIYGAYWIGNKCTRHFCAVNDEVTN